MTFGTCIENQTCDCGKCGCWAVRIGYAYVGRDGFRTFLRCDARRMLKCNARAVQRWWKDAGFDARVIRFVPRSTHDQSRKGERT